MGIINSSNRKRNSGPRGKERKSMKMHCPKCGNKEFFAHQVLRADVVVDGNNEFVRNLNRGLEASIYDAGTPYGPYTCTNCGYEFDVD